MKSVSARRRARHGGGEKYRGSPGSPAVKERKDYQGDAPAFICERCGARVLASRPTHRAGGGGGAAIKPWNRCGAEADVASGKDVLAALSGEEAITRELVTFQQIANRFGVSVATIRDIKHRLPDPVAKLANNAGAYLFDARAVEAAVRGLSPRWLR